MYNRQLSFVASLILSLSVLGGAGTDFTSVSVSADGKLLSSDGATVSQIISSEDNRGRPYLRFSYKPDREGQCFHLTVKGLRPHNWVVSHGGWMLGTWTFEQLSTGIDLGAQDAGTCEIGKRGGPRKPDDWSEWLAMLRSVKSTFDGTMQPCYFWAPVRAKDMAVPLIVGLHTWSGDWHHTTSYASVLNFAKKNGWAMIGPNYRGANDHVDACGGDAAIQDIIDAVDFAKREVRIDPKRIYIIGGSGGGHMALLMAGRHPEIWAGCVAFCPISDLSRWYSESKMNHPGRDPEYAQMMESVCGGNPEDKPEEYAKRSPLTWLQNARRAGVPVYIATGIHDGWTGSVPVGHAIRAYNALCKTEDLIDESAIEQIETSQSVPLDVSKEEVVDPFYDSRVFVRLRRTSGKVRLTLFEGGHGGNFAAGFDFLSRQIQGGAVVWNLPVAATGKEEKLAK